jgi:hypothetical protein
MAISAGNGNESVNGEVVGVLSLRNDPRIIKKEKPDFANTKPGFAYY